MTPRRAWTVVFLALTGAAVAMEIVAGIVWPSSARPAWTDLVVGNVPAPITTAAVGALVAWLPGHFIAAYKAKQAGQLVAVPSTQSRYPWRATLRTAVAGAVALLPTAVEVLSGLHVDSGTAVGGIVVQTLALMSAATRLLARPDVEAFLHTYLPWLAPTAAPPQR